MTYLHHGKWAVNGGKPKTANNFTPGDFITVFSDASWCPHTRAWGYCFWAKWSVPAKSVVLHDGGKDCESPEAAEIAALRAAMAWVAAMPKEERAGKVLVMQSDCINAFPILEAELDSLRANSNLKRAYFKHVKGHRGLADPRASINTLCDTKAKAHMRKHRKEVNASVVSQ